MSDTIKTPWTQEQIVNLNRYQREKIFHPYTCGGNRMDDDHRAYQAEYGGDFGELIATKDGWCCPVCGYRQDWAMAAMADKELLDRCIEERKKIFGDGMG